MHAVRARFPALLGLLAWGCLDAGRSHPAPSEEGPATLVLVRDGQIVQRARVDGPGAGAALSGGEDTQLYLVFVPLSRLVSQVAALDVSRMVEIDFVDAPSTPERCETGVLTGPRSLPSLDVPLSGLADVTELSEAEPRPLDEWPSRLPPFSLRVPVEGCKAARATYAPFGEDSPLVEFGGHLGIIPIASEAVGGLTNITEAAYVDDDRVLVVFLRTLALLRRGEPINLAPMIELADPLRAKLSSPGLETHAIAARVRYGEDGRTAQAIVVLLIHYLEGGDADDEGFSVFEIPITDAGFGAERLLHRERSGAGKVSDLALGVGDSFALGWSGNVLYFDGNTATTVPLSGAYGTRDLSFSFEGRLPIIVAAEPLIWLEVLPGSNTAPKQFRPMRGDPNLDFATGLTWLRDGERTRLFGGTSIPTLFERTGASWQERRIWQADDLAECSSPARWCGRGQPTPRLEVEDMTDTRDGRVAYLIRGCPSLFIAVPDEDRCVETVALDVVRYQNRAQPTRLRRVDRRDNRVLIAGDAGLLLEVELE